MKKLFVFFVFLVSNIYALDSLSASPDENKKLITNVLNELKIPVNNKRMEIINGFLKDFLVSGWSAHWISNSSGSASKIKESSAQICDMTIYNNNRITNVTFSYFKNEKQLLINTKEYVPVNSDVALQKYKDTKSNSKYTLRKDEENYAYFQENNMLNFNAYHIKSPSGLVVYESVNYVDMP